MQKFFTWFITSSVDPEKTSLTIKGLLAGILPLAITLAPALCSIHLVCLGSDSISLFFGMVGSLVAAVGTAVASVMVVYGLLRKIMAGQWSAESIG